MIDASDQHLVSLLQTELDEGEAETIALSLQERPQGVLLDEKDARAVARRLRLPVLGTVGILMWAKRAALLASLKEELDALQGRGQFRLSEAVYCRALREAGECGGSANPT